MKMVDMTSCVLAVMIVAAAGHAGYVRQSEAVRQASVDLWQARQEQAAFDARWKDAVWLAFDEKTLKYAEVKP